MVVTQYTMKPTQDTQALLILVGKKQVSLLHHSLLGTMTAVNSILEHGLLKTQLYLRVSMQISEHS